MSNTALDHDRACAFAVNLKWSRQPITRESLPDIPALHERYLYLCRRRLGDEVLYGIRAGFFPNGRTAARFAESLREYFAAAEPVLVCSKEFSASASAGLLKRRSVSKPTPPEQQRATAARPLPRRASVTPLRTSAPRPERAEPTSFTHTGKRVTHFPKNRKVARSTPAQRPSERIESASENERYLADRRPALLFWLLVAVVVFYSDFSDGSMNGNVALLSMLLAAASGFLGRYLYTKTHDGQCGRRISRQELQREARAVRIDHANTALVPKLHERLMCTEDRVLSSLDTSLHSVFRSVGLALKTRWAEFRLTRTASHEVRRSGSSSRITREQRQELQRSIHADIAERLRNLRRLVQLGVHQRLFVLWRSLHYPLFFALVVAAAAHIVAVHT